MKHYTHIFIALLAALSLTACDSHDPSLNIGVAQCSHDDWRQKFDGELEREVLLYYNTKLSILSADDDAEQQIRDIRALADQECDVIIVSPIDSVSLAPVIAQTMEKGIPVITFDRKISAPCYTAHVGADNTALGRAAAKYIKRILPDGGMVFEIIGLDGSSPAHDRHVGFAEELTDFPAIEVIEAQGDWTYESARSLADSLLRLYPDARAVFAHNDRMGLGVREAADSLAIQGLKIVGIDGLPSLGIWAVADGKLDATFIYPTAVRELVEVAVHAARGDSVEPENIVTSVQPVDKSNAEILLQLADAVDKESDKVNFLKTQVDEYISQRDQQKAMLIAVLIIMALLAVTVFLLLHFFWARKSHQDELRRQNDQLKARSDELAALNARLEEATQAKLVFFTNVSHDLRTPLTLVAEPIAQLAAADNLSQRQQTLVALAAKNIQILMRLINQILDFRKYENGKLELSLAECDLRAEILEWADSFRPLAQKRSLKLHLDIQTPEGFSVAVDPEKMERIFFNLMSNAFRYTPDNGVITATLSADSDYFTLTVADNGRGMSDTDIRRIFERFYQADKVRPGGSGIGLALVKAFVNLHGGSITVQSAPGQGSAFTVVIPIRHVSPAAQQAEALIDHAVVQRELAEVAPPEPDSIDPDKPRLLIIDDNADIRALVQTILSDQFTVLEAANGQQGLRMALKYIPAIIICDVMMPGMDGMECVERIKAEDAVSHIPVLMLTACTLDEQRIEGYRHGADGYLAKPFDGRMLRARIEALVANRSRIAPAKPHTPKPTPSPAAIGSQPIDNDFYDRFMAIVEAELANPDISVEEIGQRLGLSRVQFYRKVKALTNFSPVEVLRQTRLKAAYRLLTTTELTVAEVTYRVGFATPSYFAKCFKDLYGELPTEVQKRTAKTS